MSEPPAGRSPLAEDESQKQERAEERALFLRYKADPSPHNEEALIEKFRPLVYRIVHRFRFQQDQFDDLVQVGTLGLTLAMRRFDPEMNFRFSTYAWQTIQGEIQRYFRDKTWAVSVPRDLKERSLKVFNAVQELSRAIGHEPTAGDVAQACGLSEEQVQEAMELGSAYHPQSFLDNAREADSGLMISAQDFRGTMDMSAMKRGVFWRGILANLPSPEALVVRLYFFEQWTQKEIADHLLTSQMNVSRIMRKALGCLRQLVAQSDLDDLGSL
jgi:RNA polymerase sigma-B factor